MSRKPADLDLDLIKSTPDHLLPRGLRGLKNNPKKVEDIKKNGYIPPVLPTHKKKRNPNSNAPFGNKLALGNRGGAPRRVSPQPEECIELGKEMVEWVKKNKPTHLSEWFSIQKMIPWERWDRMQLVPEFLPFYEVAIALVAQNARNGTLHPSLAQRFLNLYHRDLAKNERDILADEAKIKKGLLESVEANLVSLAKAAYEGKIKQK